MSAENITIGVEYDPSITLPRAFNSNVPLSASNVRDFGEIYGVEFIRIQWVDLINNIRYRVVSLSYFAKLLAAARPGVTLTKCVLGLVFLHLAPGFSAVGEYLYAVDMRSFRLCPYAPGHASVMGWFQEKVPIGGSVEVDICPRTILKRIVSEAEDAGARFLVGFETEFTLLRSTNPIKPVNDHGWSNSAALLTGAPETAALEEMARALQEARVEVQMYHAEAAPGQYEMITGPLQPLDAADALVLTRETIYNIANKHGLRATLAPVLDLSPCGSAAHTHISVHSTSGETPPPSNHANLNALEASFLAGLLEHLPAAAALTMPIPVSYQRMRDGVWSGGTWVCWGTDNREAPVRLCNAASPASRNFEVKCADGTSSPYLALAGLLGAGLTGIGGKSALEVAECVGEVTAAEMMPEERKELGITARMPRSIKEARENLAGDYIMREILGNELVEKYLAVNEVLGTALIAPDAKASMVRLAEYY